MKFWSLLIMIVVCLWGSSALAQFTAMDRADKTSRVSVRVDFSDYDEVDSLFLRPEIYGQYVFKSGFGLYASLPLQSSIGDQDTLVTGNIEFGGLLVAQIEKSTFIFRLGLMLPTAPEGDEEQLTAYGNAYARLTDVAQAMPRTKALRLAMSPIARTGIVFFRADLGLDVLMPKGQEAEMLLRGNLGVGLDFGEVEATAEVINVESNSLTPGVSGAVHAMSFSLHYGPVYASLLRPMDYDDPIVFGVGFDQKF